MNKNSPLQVVQIASGDLWAGAEVQLYTLCKALHECEDIKVSVILLNHGTLADKLRDLGIPVEVLDETRLNTLQIGFRTYSYLKQHKPDVVHTHRIKENFIGGLAAWFARIPSLRSVHGAPEHRPGWKKPHKLLQYGLDWFIGRFLQTRIIAVSSDLKTILLNTYPENKIRVVENGIDIHALAPFTKQATATRTRPSAYKIGLVGRLVPVKRVDVFINTAQYLRQHHPELDCQFYVYGDGPLQNELTKQIETLALQDRVHLEGHTNAIHSKIAELDALLITSDHEGLPMTLLETMVIGTPVIAHSVGGIIPVCQMGQCCELVKTNDAIQFAKALVHRLTEWEETQRKASLAQQRIKENYSAEANAKSFINIYRLSRK